MCAQSQQLLRRPERTRSRDGSERAMSERDKTAILVAGMHRSGTSAVSRVLSLVGCELPNTLMSPGLNDNETGFWESQKIAILNEEILASAGSTWSDWQAFNPGWYDSPVAGEFHDRAVTLLHEEFDRSRLFVLKDPRICRMLPFWIRAIEDFGARPCIVSPIRNPLDVAASLEVRDGIDTSVGHLLWLRHVLAAESASRGLKRAYLRFEELLVKPHAVADSLGTILGISWPRSSAEVDMEIDAFLSARLRHHGSEDSGLFANPRLSDWIRASFEIFARWARGQVGSTDTSELDRIQASFDQASPAFDRAVSVGVRSARELASMRYLVADRDARLAELDHTLADRDTQLETLNRTVADRDARLEALNHTLADRDTQLETLNRTVADRDARLEALNHTLADRDTQLETLNRTVADRDARLEALNHTLADRDTQLETLNRTGADRDARLEALNREVAQLYGSNSWRLTAPLRDLRRALGPARAGTLEWTSRVARLLYRATPLPRSVKTRIKVYVFELAGPLLRNTAAYQIWRRNQPHQARRPSFDDQERWCVISTHHTSFVAQLVANRLHEHGWSVETRTTMPNGFLHDWYVVICAQMFKVLPPPEKRIVFQLEQSVSSRWFTTAYLDVLKHSFSVLEYSLANIEFLRQHEIAYPHVHYLPIGSLPGQGDATAGSGRTYDILFYGDSRSSPRRQRMIAALQEEFRVCVLNEVFGSEMQAAIANARVVINLHYYENALLEIPRIQECLSLGTPVVSETAQDQDDYPELGDAVRFFETGSIPAMLSEVRKTLEYPVPQCRIADAAAATAARFKFMFDRFLVASDFLPAPYVARMTLPLPQEADRIGLSLPETVERRRAFQASSGSCWTLFDGIRRSPGWIGCGLSYQSLARHSLAQGISRLVVAEDDVSLPDDFDRKLGVVHEFLDARAGEWDIFSGMISDLHPQTKVLAAETFGGLTFLTIDRITSMVFNIYSRNALRILTLWDPEDLDPVSNTIDRFLEAQADLRIVVAVPFLVGHREDLESVLWGFRNTQYVDMIAKSERTMMKMAARDRCAPQGANAKAPAQVGGEIAGEGENGRA